MIPSCRTDLLRHVSGSPTRTLPIQKFEIDESHQIAVGSVTCDVERLCAVQPSICEIFFSPTLVLVEGREDIAYFITYLHLMGHEEALQRSGCNFVATDKKSNLITPCAAATSLGIPTFLVFDADAHLEDRNGLRNMHRVDSLALLRLAGHPDQNPLPAASVMLDNLVIWTSEIHMEVIADFPRAVITEIIEEVRRSYGQVTGLEKNPLFIADWLTKAWERGLQSEKLKTACGQVLAFCERRQ